MSVKPARKLAIVQRRQKVADLFLQGWSQDAIGRELGISQPQVAGDLKKVRESWRQSAIRDFDAARDQELARIQRLEREAWAAWERSQQPSQTAVVDGQVGAQRAKRTVKHQHGDARFLDVVLRCIEARRQLLGLDAPAKIAPTTPGGRPLTIEERRDHIQAILQEHFGVAALLPGQTTEAANECQPTEKTAGVDDGRGVGAPEPVLG
jgi:hypothetical protein